VTREKRTKNNDENETQRETERDREVDRERQRWQMVNWARSIRNEPSQLKYSAILVTDLVKEVDRERQRAIEMADGQLGEINQK
jgi:leucyl aminopeptidase